MGLFNLFKKSSDDHEEKRVNFETYDDLDDEEEDEDEYYEECPECGEKMHRSDFGRWWICENCGTEGEEDDFGNVWFADPNYIPDEDEDDDEYISVYDAACIWASHGKDEDYTFGYSEEELENAL